MVWKKTLNKSERHTMRKCSSHQSHMGADIHFMFTLPLTPHPGSELSQWIFDACGGHVCFELKATILNCYFETKPGSNGVLRHSRPGAYWMFILIIPYGYLHTWEPFTTGFSLVVLTWLSVIGLIEIWAASEKLKILHRMARAEAETIDCI